ncbi:MAG: malto-oligosyltrehalose trehalohydrolase, partial [Dehalococcoidia bacterium]
MQPLPAPGARLEEDGRCTFTVWAPFAQSVEVELLDGSRPARRAPLQRDDRGYHTAALKGVDQGGAYQFVLDGEKVRPDPASRWQPESVRGPSAVVSPQFRWTDVGWRNPPLSEYVIYEL